MKIDKIEPIKDQPGYVYVWSNSTGWPVKENDVQAFIEHMNDWYSIHGSFSRSQYEEECLKRGITPVPDDDIGSYGDTYADWGMSHYHTVPKNRKCGIEGMLRQCRWIGIKKEIPDIEERRRSAIFQTIMLSGSSRLSGIPTRKCVPTEAGKEIRFPVGDGYARYIVAKLKPVVLIHIGDAWHFEYANHLTASDVRKEIKKVEGLRAIFGSKKGSKKDHAAK